MAISRVIEVSFGRSSVAFVRVNTAYFYNNGIIFKPTDIDLPASYQVHWADSPDKATTFETIGTSEGAPIPDDLWNRSRVIYGWIYLHPTNDSAVTAYEVRIYKNARAGLPDGTEPTPAEQSAIDQLISAMNSALEQTGEDAESASQSAQSASDDADRAERARTGAETAQDKAEEAQESAERAKDDAETSERNASESERNAKGYAETASEKADAITGLTAQATTLPDGSSASASYNAETGVMSFGIPKGKDGTDGDDGYSPTANVSKSGKTATITITDKNGTTSAQVSDGTDGIDGEDGVSPAVSVTDITGGHRVVITDKDGTKSFDVEDGATGATPNLTIGTVETLEPTESATATITGTPENPVLNLGIPQGDAGEVTTEEFLKAFPTDTASGAIASFTDGADDLPLKSLVVDINPVQDLHGQDSPYPAGSTANQLDLTVARLTRCSLVDIYTGSVKLNITNGYFASVDFLANSMPTAMVERILNSEPITFELNNNNGYSISIVVYGTRSNGANYQEQNGYNNLVTITPTLFTAVSSVEFRFHRTGSQQTDITTVMTGLRVSYGDTATTFQPYENICPISGWTSINVNHSDADMTTPTTITISLGQTVYGAKLYPLEGKALINMAMVDLGTLTWTMAGAEALIYQCSPSGMTLPVIPPYTNRLIGAICSMYPPSTNVSISTSMDDKSWIRNAGNLYIRDTTYSDATAFKSAMSGVQLVYELATPLEIQLTPNQVNSLLGVNNIWADSGDTEVVYRADTKLFIERLTAPDSADMIADANITSGQYFMVGNSLYKATANIANGSAIIVGTNAVRKSLSEALNEINS